MILTSLSESESVSEEEEMLMDVCEADGAGLAPPLAGCGEFPLPLCGVDLMLPPDAVVLLSAFWMGCKEALLTPAPHRGFMGLGNGSPYLSDFLKFLKYK